MGFPTHELQRLQSAYDPRPSLGTSFYEFQDPHGIYDLSLNLPETDMVRLPLDPPSSAPPYRPLLDQVMDQGVLFKAKDELHTKVKHSFYLHAGQSQPNNGSLGRHFTPVFSPEYLHGRIYSCSI